jgi:orotate phosphoribosyltransferase-like protein
MRRLSEGVSRGAIADELGVKWLTVKEWAQEAKTSPKEHEHSDVAVFAQVAVVASRADTSLVVHTRQGLRIDGLSLEDVVTLLGALATRGRLGSQESPWLSERTRH